MSHPLQWCKAWLAAQCFVGIHSYKSPVKPSTPALQYPRILDQLRERILTMHYSLSTEQVYVYWVGFFIRWSGTTRPMPS
jgi:hypothetical protein